MKTNPDTPLKEITSTLAKQGVKVSDNLIYSLKSQMKNKKQKAKKATVLTNGKTTGITNPVEMIREIKTLAGRAGGFRTLKEIVDVLAE